MPQSSSSNNSNEHSLARRPVVFLDRDGTINVELGYIREVERLVLIDGAAKAVRKLNEAGVAAILVTNQTGAARGFYSEEHIRALHERLVDLLRQEGAFLDAIYYCPHLDGAPVAAYALNCHCRKPAPGMVEQAFLEYSDLDRGAAFVVGDKASDIELARNCGAKGVLVRTGYGEAVIKGEYQAFVAPDYEASSIVDGIDWILSVLPSALKS